MIPQYTAIALQPSMRIPQCYEERNGILGYRQMTIKTKS